MCNAKSLTAASVAKSVFDFAPSKESLQEEVVSAAGAERRRREEENIRLNEKKNNNNNNVVVGVKNRHNSPRTVLLKQEYAGVSVPAAAAAAAAATDNRDYVNSDTTANTNFGIPNITTLDDVISSAEYIDEAFQRCELEYNLDTSFVNQPGFFQESLHGGGEYSNTGGFYHQNSSGMIPSPLVESNCHMPYAAQQHWDYALPSSQGFAAVKEEQHKAATHFCDTLSSQQQQQLWGRCLSSNMPLGGGRMITPRCQNGLPKIALRKRKVGDPMMQKAKGCYEASQEPRKVGGESFGKGGSSSKRKRSSFPRATTKVLKNWLKENILKPYPTDSDKRSLCAKCDLTLSQLQTWFINARIRMWKPCIEEIYKLKMQNKGEKWAAMLEKGKSSTPNAETMNMIHIMSKAIPNLKDAIRDHVDTFMSTILKAA